MNILDVINKIECTPSTNEKLKILKSYKDIEGLKEIFELSLNPDIVFNVKQKLLDTVQGENEPCIVYESECDPNLIFECCDRLLKNRKDIKEYLQKVVLYMSPSERELFFRVLLKDPKCGMSVKSINKVWPNLIDTGAKLCKAEPYSPEIIKKNIKFPAYAQIKADGARCLMVHRNDGEFKFISSSGKEYKNLNSLFHAFNKIIDDFNFRCVIDGELLVHGDDGNYLPRKEGNGILNKSLKNTITDKEADRIHFVVWDLIMIEEYDNDDYPYNMIYEDRWDFLNRDITKKAEKLGFNNIHAIGCNIVYSEAEALTEFRKATANGEEGIILKNMNFFWQNKRVKDQVKFKLEMESTLKVVGWNKGNTGTKYEDQLGALVCESEDGLVKVDVGSGLDDAFRKDFAKNPRTEWYIEVRSNGLIENVDHTFSLFLPRMIEERFDKQKADSYQMILDTQNSILGLK